METRAQYIKRCVSRKRSRGKWTNSVTTHTSHQENIDDQVPPVGLVWKTSTRLEAAGRWGPPGGTWSKKISKHLFVSTRDNSARIVEIGWKEKGQSPGAGSFLFRRTLLLSAETKNRYHYICHFTLIPFPIFHWILFKFYSH